MESLIYSNHQIERDYFEICINEIPARALKALSSVELPYVHPYLLNRRIRWFKRHNMFCTKCYRGINKLLASFKFSIKRWLARYHLEECHQSEHQEYKSELPMEIMERPRLLDAQKGCDSLFVRTKHFTISRLIFIIVYF